MERKKIQVHWIQLCNEINKKRKGNRMPHWCSAIFAPAVTFLSMSKGEVYWWELRSFCAIKNDNRSLFLGFSEECCDGNVSRKGCLLSPSREYQNYVPEKCQIRKWIVPRLRVCGGRGTREGRGLLSMICINHPIYPSGTIFQSAFRMEWFITMQTVDQTYQSAPEISFFLIRDATVTLHSLIC